MKKILYPLSYLLFIPFLMGLLYMMKYGCPKPPEISFADCWFGAVSIWLLPVTIDTILKYRSAGHNPSSPFATFMTIETFIFALASGFIGVLSSLFIINHGCSRLFEINMGELISKWLVGFNTEQFLADWAMGDFTRVRLLVEINIFFMIFISIGMVLSSVEYQVQDGFKVILDGEELTSGQKYYLWPLAYYEIQIVEKEN